MGNKRYRINLQHVSEVKYMKEKGAVQWDYCIAPLIITYYARLLADIDVQHIHIVECRRSTETGRSVKLHSPRRVCATGSLHGLDSL